MTEAVVAKPAVELITPLGKDDLKFESMDATEGLSHLFTFSLTALSPKNDIDPNKLLGKPLTIVLETQVSDQPRYFDGYVTRIAQVGMSGRYHAYSVTVRPWLWFLTLTSDCRVFQNKAVPQIIQEIFDKHAATKSVDASGLTGDYHKWEYCVQYRESDFAFVSRLMEQEGIYYYFRHEVKKHTLVLVDSKARHCKGKGCDALEYHPIDPAGLQYREHIKSWFRDRQILPGKFQTTDFDFKRPKLSLKTATQALRKHDHSAYEVFDYPGEYVEQTEGEHYAKSRIDEIQSEFEVIHGTTNARALCVGNVFTLTKHPRVDQNRDYLVVGTKTGVSIGGYEAADAAPAYFNCKFTVLASAQQFRPQRVTKKSQVSGPQTAIVVGPKGDEIYTDQYGRVKVRFHWDRTPEDRENASAWIRVASHWAGSNFGFVAIPRIGQEVIVDFLEGDPDQPIITGRVYNQDNMPPWGLPQNKTQTGVLTRSTKTGDYENANALRFEDKKGEEELWLHAEKDQRIEVEHDESHWVGRNRSKTIDNDETVHIKHDRTEVVDNNEKITIGANQVVYVQQNKAETINIAKALNVGAGYAITVGGGMNTAVGLAQFEEVGLSKTVLVGKSFSTKAGDVFEVSVGKSSFRMDESGNITLKGVKLQIEGSGPVTISGKDVDIN